MKIQVLSDLHLEFGSQDLLYLIKQVKSDVLVLAGDIDTAKNIVSSIAWIYSEVNKHIVVVPGNHEYYHSTKQHVDAKLQTRFAGHKYIHVLNNGVWEHNDVVFLGGTGWWTQKEVKNGAGLLNDFSVIYDLIPANYGLDWGKKSHDFFKKKLKQYTNKTVICISHNAPCLLSIDEKFKGDILNPCFANNWEHLISSYKPKFWIHGHTHTSKEYKFDDTTIICNPYGYYNYEVNKLFDPYKTINIGDTNAAISGL